MKVQLIVDSSDFWECLQRDIAQAKQRVWLQTMSFEGDKVGQDLTQALIESSAPSRRIIVDNYSRFVINDQFIFNPKALLDPEFRKELQMTQQLGNVFKEAGVEVFHSNPLGWGLSRYPARNHKKMIVVDDQIAYVGGINFCDHNFDWHDMMFRFENHDTAQFLASDFENSWNGQHHSLSQKIENYEFFLCDGTRSRSLYEEMFERIKKAKASITLHSPYLTFPWLSLLKLAAAQGVRVTIISPQANNKPLLKNYLLHEIQDTTIRLMWYPKRMSHLKALLIDDEILIAGSSNFDCVSYHAEQEVIFASEDPALIAQFKEKILEPDLLQSQVSTQRIAQWKGELSHSALKVAAWYCSLL